VCPLFQALWVWLPLVWNPWRRTTEGHHTGFRFKVVVALSGVPLHARNLDVAQFILGLAYVNPTPFDFRDRPTIDDHEFFVSAWCWHPSFIPTEVVIFIPKPHVLGVLPPELWASGAHLPGLRYPVRTRLVAYQDWGAPPGSPDVGGGHDDDRGDDERGNRSYNSTESVAGNDEVDERPAGHGLGRSRAGPSAPAP